MSAAVPSRAGSRGVLQQVIDQRVAAAGRLGVFTQLAKITLLVDRLQQESLNPLGLNFVDYSILRVLQVSGDPYQLSASRLADAVVRSTGGMTKIIDRLERRGLVERLRDADDRRSVLVHLTAAGSHLASRASDAYTAARAGVLDHLSADDVDLMLGSMGQLISALEDVRPPGA